MLRVKQDKKCSSSFPQLTLYMYFQFNDIQRIGDHFFSKIFQQILSDSDTSAPFIESSHQNSLLLLIIMVV